MYRKDDKIYYDWIDYQHDMKEVIRLEFDHVVGIYRGSVGMAAHVSNVFEVPMSIVGLQSRDGADKMPYPIYNILSEDTKRILIVDDIYDTGFTMNKVIKLVKYWQPKSEVFGFCLFGKDNDVNVSCANIHDGSWIVFPWETLNESV
jgi:hypoxanthine phosphoribosyltransferase